MAKACLDGYINPYGVVVSGLVGGVEVSSSQWDEVGGSIDAIHSSVLAFAT